MNSTARYDVYNETRMGIRVSLTRTTFRQRFSGEAALFYNLEQVGIDLNSGWHGIQSGFPFDTPANVPPAILTQTGNHLFNRFGSTISYDTRNAVNSLPNWGQLTEFDPTISVGDAETFYKLELKTAWFFPGLFKGHVIEVDGRTRHG